MIQQSYQDKNLHKYQLKIYNSLMNISNYKYILIMKELEDKQIFKSEENSHKNTSIKYEVGYQFKSDRVGAQIFKHITSNFILPAEINRYFYTYRKNKQRYECQIIDYRVLKFQSEKFGFLIHDEQQSQNTRQISQRNQNNLFDEYLNLIEKTKSKYKDEFKKTNIPARRLEILQQIYKRKQKVVDQIIKPPQLKSTFSLQQVQLKLLKSKSKLMSTEMIQTQASQADIQSLKTLQKLYQKPDTECQQILKNQESDVLSKNTTLYEKILDILNHTLNHCPNKKNKKQYWFFKSFKQAEDKIHKFELEKDALNKKLLKVDVINAINNIQVIETCEKKNKCAASFTKQRKNVEQKNYLFKYKITQIDAWENGLKKLNSILLHKDKFKKLQQISFVKRLLQISKKEKKCIKVILFQEKKQKAYRFLFRFQGSIQEFNSPKKQYSKTQQIEMVEEEYNQTDFIMELQQNQEYDISIHQIQVNLRCKTIQISSQGFVQADQDKLNEAKVKLIEVDINKVDSFISQKLSKKREFLECISLESKQTNNYLNIFARIFVARRNKIFGERHYNLAFQGGGAKGLAYVGAYKAIKQNKIDSKQIKIKSIMGSSAGGIVAIAASTGMSYREMQQICYKMGDIAKNDRICQKDQTAFDQFGNQITFEKIENMLKKIFVEVGFLNQSTFNEIASVVKQKLTELDSDLVEYLRFAFPDIADIFQGVKNVTKQQGWLWWKKSENIAKPAINWNGILLHGALMKGEVIHNIAAECLVKYFINESYKDNFQLRIRDLSFQDQIQDYNKVDPQQITKLIHNYKEERHNIFITSLQSYWFGYFDKSTDFNEFLICILNKTMVLGNQFLNDQGISLLIDKVNILNYFSYSNHFLKKVQILLSIMKSIKQKKKNIKGKADLNFQFHQQIKLIMKNQLDLFQTIQKLLIFIQQGEYKQKKEKYSIAYYFKINFIWNQLQLGHIQDIREKQINFLKVSNKLKFLTNIDEVLSCHTYNQINAHTNQVNFLNHKDFFLNKIYNNEKVAQFQLFRYIKQLFTEGCSNKIFQEQEKFKKMFLQIKKDKQSESCIKQRNFFLQLSDYIITIVKKENEAFQCLLKEASKMTMKQYYILNPIEITCTSVDLQNKILRLFNHKTTPNLPICKAVQMTGSYPVAFKPLKWQKQWGYYHVDHKMKKTVVDISGHEFTDGGLLANFPIKYFDNQLIRKSYFSHGMQRENSIMIGFGLNQQQQGSYNEGNKQIIQKYQKNIKKEVAFQKITNHFTTFFKIKEAFMIFLKSRWLQLENQQQKLGKLSSRFTNQIPILKMLIKIFTAYPNADRNLSLEAFPSFIMLQTQSNSTTLNIKQLIRLKSKSVQQIQRQKKQKWQWKIQNCYNQFNYFKNIITISCNKKQFQEQGNRWDEIQQLITRVQENLSLKIQFINNGFITLSKRNLNKPFFDEDKPHYLPQKQMSLFLLKILKLTLKNKKGCSNNLIKDTLSYRYVYFSFIAQENQQNNAQLQDISLNRQIKDVQSSLNHKNLKKFILTYNFTAIQKNLNLWDFREKYLKLMKQNDILIGVKNNKNKEEIVNKLIKQTFQEYKQSNFNDFSLIDVSYSMRRMIKYLYLEIKLRKKKGKSFLSDYLNANNFDDQLKDDIISNYKKIQMLVEYEKCHYDQLIDPNCPNYLTFDEIFDFLCELKDSGVTVNNQKHYLQYEWQFQQYLSNLNVNNQFRQKMLFCYDVFTDNVKQRSYKILKQQFINNPFDYNKKKFRNYELIQKLQQNKFQQSCQDILLSAQINAKAIQKLRYTQDVKSQLKRILQKNEVDQFASFLFNKFQFTNLDSIKIQNEINIRSLKYQTKKSLKNLVFGEKLEKQKKVRDRMKIFEKRIKKIYVENNLNESTFDNFQEVEYSYVDYWLFKYFYLKTIQDQVHGKYSVSEEKEKQQFYEFHNAYFKDIIYFFRFLVSILLLLVDYQSKIIKLKPMNQPNNLLNPQVKQLYRTLSQIAFEFMDKYEKLTYLPQNLINLQLLDQIFLIKHVHLQKIISILKYMETLRIPRQQYKRTLQIFSQVIMKFNDKQSCLPLFSSDWQLLTKINHIKLYTKYSKLYNNDTPSKKHLRTLGSIFQNNRNQRMLRNAITGIKQHPKKIQNPQDKQIKKQVSLQRIAEQQKKEGKQQSSKVHLVIQQVCDSSAFCAYYHYMQNFKPSYHKKDHQQNLKLGMITSKMFGFLVCLGEDIDQIRSDLYKIRNYLFQMFNPERILQSYKEQGPCISLNYNSLIESYKLELFNAFKILGQEYQNRNRDEKIDFSAKFNQIRMIIEQQQHYYLETCNQILDQAATQIKRIDNDFLQTQRANQIAKTFGFDYICNFNKRHQYSRYNKQCKETYHQIMNQFYEQFGSIISSLLCNFVTEIFPFTIKENQVEHFTKGFLLARLMTVYKLKAFIFAKLEENGFPYDITLNSFYERCGKKIILNFVVVNITNKRLQFLNKVTSPNMPIWAAIVASSTLPGIHRCFQSQRHWQDLQGEQLETKQMLNFFKDNQIMKRKYTLYNSSMYISSIPMQLLANNVYFHRHQQFCNKNQTVKETETLKEYRLVGFAFNKTRQQTNLAHLTIQKKYFNFSHKMIFPLIKIMFRYNQLIVTNRHNKNQKKEHLNRSYETHYNPLTQIKDLLLQNNINVNTLATIIQANDNLIFKWYSSKLVRLPIKIGTLQFNKAVDNFINLKYKIKVPTEKAKETIVRSYQIAKTFIHNIQNRFKHSQQNYYKIHSQSDPQRFKVKLRAQIINAINKQSGFNQQYFKVTFLNHSKWNQNMYSNFIVQYKIKSLRQYQFQFQRCQNSQIVWKTEIGSKLLVRFYYLHYFQYIEEDYKLKLTEDYFSSKNSCIMFSQFILSFQKIFEKLPNKNSYDYQFIYAWNQSMERSSQMDSKKEEEVKIKINPVKLNDIPVTQQQGQLLPILIITNQRTSARKGKIGQKFIKRSNYNL